MNNKIIAGLVLLAIVIGGWFFFMQKQSPSQPQPQMKVEANAVTIQNFAFNPATLTVKQGTKVTWTNQDTMIHKIKSATFNSPDLNQGDKFEFTFDNPGSFDYSCSIHPSMTGKIVVE
jgi:plastocyanin